MKNITSLKKSLAFLFLFIFSFHFPADSWGAVRSLIGYRYIALDEKFSHNTHPDDNFLPNSNQPGSAGETRIKKTSWLFVGARYLKEFENDTALNIDLGALIGDNEKKAQNANDNRPAGAASFIYSKAEMGVQGAVGYSLRKGRFRLGAEAQLSGIYIESGWDRFDNQEKEDSKFKFVPTIGPKIGIYLWDDNLVEVTVQKGEEFAAGVNFQFKLW